jgi:protein farnesyltransferase subunit beta
MVYWILHALELLNSLPDDTTISRTIDFLSRCQNNTSGGFGGGPQQFSHLAPSYAAVSTIALLQREEGYKMINRQAMYEWLLRLKQPNGGFCMHEGGEIDVRFV